jgi:hypothetical protein
VGDWHRCRLALVRLWVVRWSCATLTVASARAAGNTGANAPGVDGLTAAAIKEGTSVPGRTGTSERARSQHHRQLI